MAQSLKQRGPQPLELQNPGIAAGGSSFSSSWQNLGDSVPLTKKILQCVPSHTSFVGSVTGKIIHRPWTGGSIFCCQHRGTVLFQTDTFPKSKGAPLSRGWFSLAKPKPGKQRDSKGFPTLVRSPQNMSRNFPQKPALPAIEALLLPFLMG